MYVPLQIEARFWFKPRAELDSRLGPSPSIQALKVVRDINKKHLGFILQHEKKLLQQIDPEDAKHIYMQLGLKPPEPGNDPCPECRDEDAEPYRRGDLEPITVVGLRSHHHPVAQVRAEAFATWQIMRDDYYKNRQAADSSSWAVQDDNAFSEADIWTTQEIPAGEDLSDASTSAAASASDSDCDDEYDEHAGDDTQWDVNGWPDGEGDADMVGEQRSDLSPELPGSDHWLAELPTPPASDTHSPLPSPVLSESQLVPTAGVSSPSPWANSSVSDDSGLDAGEELSRVLNDRKIMEAFLDGIAKRIKESYLSKSEKEAERAVDRQRYRTTQRNGRKTPGEGRGDPRRPLRLCRSLGMSPEQAGQHKPEETCRAHFETHFQMTHQYEDAVGEVHAEPVTTEGLPPENKFEWMRAARKKQRSPY